MAYLPLNIAGRLPRHVASAVAKLERHYLQPAHALFRLPLPHYRINGEFQVAIAQLLMASIAGASTTLYSSTGSNGSRFRDILVDYYPFSLEPPGTVTGTDAARTLWTVFRNPLAHDLGLDVEKRKKAPKTKVLRLVTKAQSGTRGLTEKMIEMLEDSSTRPTQKPTIAHRSDATVLSVDILYWGVRCTIEALLADNQRVQEAEQFLATL